MERYGDGGGERDLVSRMISIERVKSVKPIQVRGDEKRRSDDQNFLSRVEIALLVGMTWRIGPVEFIILLKVRKTEAEPHPSLILWSQLSLPLNPGFLCADTRASFPVPLHTSHSSTEPVLPVEWSGLARLAIRPPSAVAPWCTAALPHAITRHAAIHPHLVPAQSLTLGILGCSSLPH